jgi:hypothetical protein
MGFYKRIDHVKSGNMKAFLGKQRQSQQGIAIVTVLVLLAVVSSLIAATSLLALSNRAATGDTITTTQAIYAAEAGIEMALKRVYYDSLEAWKGSTDKNVKNREGQFVQFDSCAFKKWLTGIGNGASITQLQNNNAGQCNYVNFVAPVTSPAFPTLLNNSTVTISSADAASVAIGDGTYNVSVQRRDDGVDQISLIMTSLGQVKTSDGRVLAERRINRSLKIAAPPYDGDRYAMLTSATNCSFCHLQVDSMRRAYSTSGTFDPVRIGVVTGATGNPDGKIQFKDDHGDPNVLIYGSLYTRAINPDRSGFHTSGLTAPDLSTNGIRWAVTDSANKIKAGSNQSNVGALFAAPTPGVALGSARDATATPWFKTPNQKLYYKYPTSTEVNNPNGIYKGTWPDAPLPDGFPAVIPDGGDNHVSDADWLDYVKTAPQGSVVSVTGAVIYGVRRPTSGTANFPVGANIPWVYDPLNANNVTDTAGIPPNAAAVIANPQNYRRWLLMQALATPNNRDYLTGTAPGFNVTATGGSFRNNFYVNYNPTNSTLNLYYCNAGLANLSTCGRAGDPTGAAGTNNLSVLTVTNVNDALLFPQTSNTALQDLQTGTDSGRAGLFNGNVIMDAGRLDQARNIKIEGTILVNGDLVIRGKFSGNGRIVARGNIYVMGDTVYGCGSGGTTNCTIAQYGAADGLPRLALLAGGHIVAGTYDAPDSRIAQRNRAFDLINDQNAQNRRPNGANNNWTFFSIPGSTGRGPRNFADTNPISGTLTNYGTPNNPSSWDGQAGFLLRVVKGINSRSSATGRLLRLSPHGLMLTGGESEEYESNGGNFIGGTAINVPMLPMYPSNGPILIGNRLNNGVLAASALPTNIGCSDATTNPSDILNFPARRYIGLGTTNVATIPFASINFGFWCPPANGQFVRTGATAAAPATPSTTAAAWATQHAATDRLLDGGAGMTTGWLAGALNYQGTWFRGDVSQTRLIQMMWLSTMETNNRALMPFRTDGLYYTAASINSMLRREQDVRGSTISRSQARWLHNGSVIASELGFLVTGNAPNPDTNRTIANRTTSTMDFNPGTGSYSAAGNWGPGIGIFYDDRLNGFLQVLSANQVKVVRTGVFSQAVTK